MKTTHGLLMIAAACLSQTASAGETKIERRETCVCTTGEGPPPPGGQSWNHEVPPPGQDGDVDVQVFRDEGRGENRVVVIRRSRRDGADTNKDGKVSRKEFMSRAEKHFDEMDENNDGSLSPEEAQPPMPPLPPMPPMPPMPPVPPVPPQH